LLTRGLLTHKKQAPAAAFGDQQVLVITVKPSARNIM